MPIETPTEMSTEFICEKDLEVLFKTCFNIKETKCCKQTQTDYYLMFGLIKDYLDIYKIYILSKK